MQLQESYEFEYQVLSRDLADQLPVDEMDQFPPVLATSRMIALMEVCAARQLLSQLESGQLSVGVDVHVNHCAATLVDRTITLKTRFVGMQDKLYQFEVEAFDSGGLIGSGTHTRAVVDSERLLARAAKKG